MFTGLTGVVCLFILTLCLNGNGWFLFRRLNSAETACSLSQGHDNGISRLLSALLSVTDWYIVAKTYGYKSVVIM